MAALAFNGLNISQFVHSIKSLHTDTQFLKEFRDLIWVWIGDNREGSYALDIGSGYFTTFFKLDWEKIDFSVAYHKDVKRAPSSDNSHLGTRNSFRLENLHVTLISALSHRSFLRSFQ